MSMSKWMFEMSSDIPDRPTLLRQIDTWTRWGLRKFGILMKANIFQENFDEHEYYDGDFRDTCLLRMFNHMYYI